MGTLELSNLTSRHTVTHDALDVIGRLSAKLPGHCHTHSLYRAAQPPLGLMVTDSICP